MRRWLGLRLYNLAHKLHPELREMIGDLFAQHIAAQVQHARRMAAHAQHAQHIQSVARIARDN